MSLIVIVTLSRSRVDLIPCFTHFFCDFFDDRRSGETEFRISGTNSRVGHRSMHRSARLCRAHAARPHTARDPRISIFKPNITRMHTPAAPVGVCPSSACYCTCCADSVMLNRLRTHAEHTRGEWARCAAGHAGVGSGWGGQWGGVADSSWHPLSGARRGLGGPSEGKSHFKQGYS